VGEAVFSIRLMRLLLPLAVLILPATLFAAMPPNTAKAPERGSLTGQLLIASPAMQDPRFRQAVLVMVRHNRDGAMGIVINRPLGEQPLARLLAAIGEKTAGASGTVGLFWGGPVEPGQGVVLHSADYRRSGTLDIGGRVALTAAREVFRDIAAKTGPQKSLIALGYAGWRPRQLESELALNAWFTAPADQKLIFEVDRNRLWDLALQRRTRDL
jgi:putative transcriptional regulator